MAQQHSGTATVVLDAYYRLRVEGQASIADIVAYTGFRLDTVHSAVQELRRAGVLSGVGVETGDERIRAAAIREGQDLIGYVSLRS